MPRYVTVESMKGYLRNEKPTEDDPFYEAAIDTAEQAFDIACGRRFFVASTATARVFRPHPRSTRLGIDDCTTVTSVVENGVTVSASDYQLEPLNGLSSAGAVVPYTDIRRKAGVHWYTYYDEATVTVTATWGWAAIPAPVVEACKVLTKAVLDGRDLVANGVAGIGPDGSVITERDAKIVKSAIADYRRGETVMIA